MKNIDLTSPAAALAYLRSLDPATEIELPGAFDPNPADPAADAVRVITDEDPNQWAASRGKWEWTAAELIAELEPEPLAAQYEIVFDNGGGATLQNHNGSVVIHYNDMDQLARDVKELDGGDDPCAWDGIGPEGFISDDQYDHHARNGGYYAIQLDPEYRHNWPSPDDTGWNNIAAFIRAFHG